MSTPGLGDDDDLPDVTAGEYVLGVLDAAESAIARRRVATEAGFAAEVSAWENRLIPLIAETPEIAPPSTLWDAIAQRLQPVRRVREGASLWDNLPLWRGLGMGAIGLAAASMTVVFLGLIKPATVTTPTAPAAPTAVAVAVATLTAPQGGSVVFTATYDEANRQLIVTPTGPPRPQNRSPELWLMPDGQPPVSMGVLPNSPRAIAVPPGFTARSTLGVSLEPLGGSPSGAPTGPVIAVGQLMRL